MSKRNIGYFEYISKYPMIYKLDTVLKIDSRGFMEDSGLQTFVANNEEFNVRFYINERRIYCVLEDRLGDFYIGDARCLKEDKFNLDLGLKLARNRAFIDFLEFANSDYIEDYEKGNR